jgi:DNA-binding MarR family transcriptional regulator
MEVTYRTSRVLAAIAAQPDASNREVADAAGISDQGQVSKLLARLENLRLIHNPGEWRVGRRHAWRLTARGRRVERATRAEAERPRGWGPMSEPPDMLQSRLIELIYSSSVLMRALRAARSVDPPDWLIGGGVIRDRVWDHLHGSAHAPASKDVDLAFCAPRGAIQPGWVRGPPAGRRDGRLKLGAALLLRWAARVGAAQTT